MLTFQFKVDNVLTDATSVKFNDPTGTIGLRVVGDNESVVSPGTNWTRLSVGQYQYDIELEDDVAYEYWIDALFEGEHTRVQRLVRGDEIVTEDEIITLRFISITNGGVDEVSPAPVLSSPTNQYGVIDINDKTIVVEAQTSMTQIADGLFSKAFVKHRSDGVYRYYVYAKGKYIVSTTEYISSCLLVTGRYTDSTLISKMFGPDNIHTWLSLPGNNTDEPVDYALRMADFVKQAEDQIDFDLVGGFFRGTGVTTDEENGIIADFDPNAIPPIIQQLATRLAGVLMYESSGVIAYSENGRPMHRLQWHRNNVDETLKRLRYGTTVIDAGIGPRSYPTADVSCGVEKIYDPQLGQGFLY